MVSAVETRMSTCRPSVSCRIWPSWARCLSTMSRFAITLMREASEPAIVLGRRSASVRMPSIRNRTRRCDCWGSRWRSDARSRRPWAMMMFTTSPIVNVVNIIIAQGLRDRASDLHLEPQQSHLRVRFRIDGILTDALRLPKTMAGSLASRIKVMANLDIVDKHRAQDGQIRHETEGRQVDIRVSTAETIWGEKVVLCLLDQGRTVLSLDQLGLEAEGYGTMSRLLRSPFGMLVVSGPTGSGKTTTLYAAIKELDPISQNITTIEDPVEYTFENINQIQIRRVANLTFANGLRAILRQDPDVILVGEIRDRETAEIAIQSALTGHLVLN